MLDPDNAKESILDSIEWTETELKEFLRKVITEVSVGAMTFEPCEIQRDMREIFLTAIVHTARDSKSVTVAKIQRRLEGTRVRLIEKVGVNTHYKGMMLKFIFKANRFKTIQSDDRADIHKI